MAVELRGNKNASDEDALGRIHKSITRVVAKQIETIEGFIDDEEGDFSPLMIDPKMMESWQKWIVDRNHITCAAPESNEESEISKKITKIKDAQKVRLAANGGVIQFDDEE